MRKAPVKMDPAVHSFLVLRRVVGFIALLLPLTLVVPWWAANHNLLPSSMSSYYYTGMRDIFVGALCAIGIINICCRGYDRHDTTLGILSGIFAIGVAFFPTMPDSGATHAQIVVGTIHIVCASLLFLSLAYFCFFLFTMSAEGLVVTRRKRHRNGIYRVCGGMILASVLAIILFKVIHRPYLFGPIGSMFCFETTALMSFGVAWMVKGGVVLRDELAVEHAAVEYLREQNARKNDEHKELAGV